MWKYFDLNNRARRAKSKPLLKKMQFFEERLEEFPEEAHMIRKSLAPIKDEAVRKVRDELLEKMKEVEKEMKEVRQAYKTPPLPVELSTFRQISMYFGLFIGVFLSTAISQFKSGEEINISVSIGAILISAVIALILIPIVYEKLRLNPAAPFIVQFGLFVQNGVFWHVIFDSIGKLV